MDPHLIESINIDPFPWSSGDPGASERAIRELARVIPRIPPRYGSYLSVSIATAGWSQREVARHLGITQPTWCTRLQHAVRAARLAATVLPDLTPDQVRVAVLEAGHPELDADVVSSFWVQWTTASAARVVGMDPRRASEAILRVQRSGRPQEVTEGIRAIRAWCAVSASRRAQRKAYEARLRNQGPR